MKSALQAAADIVRQTSSLRCGEAQTQENKKCTGHPIDPLPDCFVPMQSFAEGRSEPRENEAPDCAGGHKREPEREKRQHLHTRCRVNELRKESEKEQCYFGIQHIGENTLPERRNGRASAKIGRQN